jgi:undecaprenyl diphosphate synthase
LTLFAFSSENWNRASDEIEKLNHLLENFLTNETNHFIENKIKVRLIGDLSPYSANIRAKIKNLEEKTTQFEGFTLTIALNYGGRQEIIAGVNTLLKSNLSTISSDDFEKVIYSALLPDVDLMIRTGGAKRISNFLLWKLAYAELYFTDILWPEFNENEFKKALNFFKAQIRNFGS